MDKVSNKIEINNQREIIKVKNTVVTEMKNAFDGLISKLAKERISELKYVNSNFPKGNKDGGGI